MRERSFARRRGIRGYVMLILVIVVGLTLDGHRDAHSSEKIGSGSSIFSRARDLRVLGQLLEDREISRSIGALVECMPLWSIKIQRTSTNEPGDYRVVFGFDVAKRHSSRGAYVSYTMTPNGASGLEILSREDSYGPLTLGRIRPTCAREICVDVLRAAALDSTFLADVEEWFDPELGASQLTVDTDASSEGNGSLPRFRLGLHRLGFAGAPHANSRYWHVYYDELDGSVQIYAEEDL